MAIIQVNFLSQTLKRTVPIQVVLPSDKVLSYTGHMSESKPYKTLYLLHGLLGNCTDWVMNTNIQRLAEDRNLAVVMPSGETVFMSIRFFLIMILVNILVESWWK